MEQLEHFFQCPYCGATISMLLDPSVCQQDYIEDCEVCCHPIEVRPAFEEGTLTGFDAETITE